MYKFLNFVWDIFFAVFGARDNVGQAGSGSLVGVKNFVFCW